MVTVQETQLTWLPCKAEGLPLPEVTWGRVYGSLPDGRHVIHNNGTIVISGTLHRDGGMYVCQAKNVLGIAKSTTLLIVHGTNYALVKPSTIPKFKFAILIWHNIKNKQHRKKSRVII